MHLSRLRVRGLRGAADGELELALPGRFAVLAGANAAGKTTLSDALYLGHNKRFPQLPRISAASLGPADRDLEVEYSFASIGDDEGPLGRQLQAQSGRSAPGTVAAAWSKTLHRNLGDSVESVSVAVLIRRLGRLRDTRMREICAALAVAVDCSD